LFIVFLWRAALFTADGAQPEKKQKSWWILRMSHWSSWKATPTLEEFHIVPLGYIGTCRGVSNFGCMIFLLGKPGWNCDQPSRNKWQG
jgi:hypothetical protein